LYYKAIMAEGGRIELLGANLPTLSRRV